MALIQLTAQLQMILETINHNKGPNGAGKTSFKSLKLCFLVAKTKILSHHLKVNIINILKQFIIRMHVKKAPLLYRRIHDDRIRDVIF